MATDSLLDGNPFQDIDNMAPDGGEGGYGFIGPESSDNPFARLVRGDTSVVTDPADNEPGDVPDGYTPDDAAVDEDNPFVDLIGGDRTQVTTDDPFQPVRNAPEFLPSWFPWAIGGTLGTVVLLALIYVVGQLFTVEV